MATVKATCPDCGDVEFPSSEITVSVCDTNGVARYLFLCPSCREAVSKAVEDRTVDLLAAAGVPVSHFALPAEVGVSRAGAPITHDDLFEFHEMLAADDFGDIFG